jgi:hypothetical protein
MYKNPFDAKTEKADHDLFWKSYLIGKRDGIFKRPKLTMNRRLPIAYRWGYNDGYLSGLKYKEGN